MPQKEEKVWLLQRNEKFGLCASTCNHKIVPQSKMFLVNTALHLAFPGTERERETDRQTEMEREVIEEEEDIFHFFENVPGTTI